jgi:hypothetical protein
MEQTNSLICKTTVLLAITIFLCEGSAAHAGTGVAAENKTVSGGADCNIISKYVWHGIVYNDNTVFQPSFWAAAHDFTLSAIGNFVAVDELNRGKFNEIDFSLAYSRQWKNFTIEPSFDYYTYPNVQVSPATGMGNIKISYAAEPFSIYANHSLDVLEYPGASFSEAGIGIEHGFDEKLSAEASLYLGFGSSRFNEAYVGIAKDALNLAEGNFSLKYNIGKSFYLQPRIEITTILDDDLRNAINALNPGKDNSTACTVGITAGLEF